MLCLGWQQDRFGRWFKVGRGTIGEAYRNSKLMLSRGVPVPCVWEHQKFEAKDADDPEKKAAYAKLTFAHIGGARLNDRGNLELRHDGPDPDDLKQLRKTRYVSPKLCSAGYEDSRGGRYRGATIAHVAATPTPVQFWQRPFEFSRGEFYLSYTPEGSTVAKEKEGKPGDEGDASGDLNALIEALRAKGMTISDRVTDLPGLIIAVESSGGTSSPTDDLGLDDEEGGGTAAAAGAPMLMSEERAAPIRKRDQKDAETRIKKLFQTGRITRPIAEKKIKEARTFEFSYTRKGDTVANPLVAWIEAREELPKHSAWKPKGETEIDMSETRGVDAPDALAGKKEDPNGVQEATDFVLQFISGPPAKK